MGAIFLWLPVHGAGLRPLQTPLEEGGYTHLTSASEVGHFLKTIEKRDTRARHAIIGISAEGRPLDALFVSESIEVLARGGMPGERLRVMIVGSLHGTEPGGAEAILMLARDLVEAPPRALLALMEFILVPLGNPDGHESGERISAGGVNLGALTPPENRALVDALARWRPDVFIDLHEATIYKPKTLARQGYLTDFETQIEIGNNPNIDPAIRALSRERIRPAIVSRLQREGLRANDYIGEIRDIGQPIAHGSLTLRNLRNRAGMEGAFSLLVENRLDPPGDTYPTPQNIRARTAKQLMSLRTVLLVCLAERHEIAARSRAARRAWQRADADERVFLVAAYGPDSGRETIPIRLRRITDGQVEMRTFRYLGRIVPSEALELPAAYGITAHQDTIGAALKRQHIRYEILRKPRECRATVQHVEAREKAESTRGRTSERIRIEEREALVRLPAGALWVSLRQPARRLIPLLLEPRSNSSLYEHRDHASLVVPGQDFFVLRIPQECGGELR
ncbi:MAG: M14 family zinc carboxypeptidase [Betaproteobacteria bacterium]|nr:M14 family zinc carboxypeptidase [Betaproteobacteria bacterium]MDH3436218.1 M14 family zinc carboxypeptidase [Betaproteobacteria bacterium]